MSGHISEALSKNQEFWQSLAADNKALNALAPQKSGSNLLEVEQAPPSVGSPMTKLKHDAEFYRDQVRVLSERVEQLQHVLALESSKVERLSSELEEKNSNESEAKAYVRNLEVMELITELQNELSTHRDLVIKLREYLSSHPEMTSQLDSHTQGALELLNSPIMLGKTNMNHLQSQHFFGSSRTQSREEDNVKQEAENREELEAENFSLYDKISILDRQLRHIQDEYDELVKKEMMNQRTLKEVQELLDDESRKCTKLEQQNKELEQQLAELREYTEPEDDIVAKEWEAMKSKLRADAMFYKRSLDQLREEYEQYRIDHDPEAMQRQVSNSLQLFSIIIIIIIIIFVLKIYLPL
ncbi:unnamed protein product [Trichobilharzia regenti]|nr:unnamed protein product [Trichobilharzia regenti]